MRLRPTPGVEYCIRYVLADLCPGNWPPSPWLGPLRHLDLQLVRVDQVPVVTPAAARNLLYGAAALSPFSSGAQSAWDPRRPHRCWTRRHAVHRDSEGLVRLLEREPRDIAPVVKCLTISLAGSTSSIGMGFSSNPKRPRNVAKRALCFVEVTG